MTVPHGHMPNLFNVEHMTQVINSMTEYFGGKHKPYKPPAGYTGIHHTIPTFDTSFGREDPTMFTHGLVTMQVIMLHLTHSGNDLFVQMNKKSAEARDAQDQANMVESAMAALNNPNDTTTLPPSVKEYMEKNNIVIDDMRLEQYLLVKDKTPQKDKGKGKEPILDKSALLAIKSVLESVSGRASDFNQQKQLKLQQTMQNYSTASQLMQSVQSMLAEMTKGTAAAIR